MALTSRRPSSLLVLAAVLSVLSILSDLRPAATAERTGQLTVFWGQHKDEGSLRAACDSGMYTTVIMSFLNVYGHGRYYYYLDLSRHPFAGIGDDIEHCQLKGVTVSLSVRGEYSLPTNQSALDLFDHLWYSYLGSSRGGVRRPFGEARLDGIDFFLERASPAADRYDVLARELAKRNIRGQGGPTWKPLHLTATPRCAFPDRRRAVERAPLVAGVFERIHVRFYDGDPNCTAWIEAAWDEWAAACPASKIYLGLTASEKAGGYLYPKVLYYAVLPRVQKAANYGGVMLWDRYYDEHSNYSDYVKDWA